MIAHPQKQKSTEDLKREIQRLKGLLEEEKNLRLEAQETLEAIRTGAVDGIVRSTPEGEQVFVLKGSDQPYRSLIEEMNEGALLLSDSGTILYCNTGFASLVDAPLDRIMGTHVSDWVLPRNVDVLNEMISGDRKNSRRVFGVAFQSTKQLLIPTQVSISKITLDSINASALIVTDLSRNMREDIKRYTANLEEEITQRKKAEEALSKAKSELEQSQIKLEEDAVRIEEYANQMEELAGERLEKLKTSERMAAIGATASMVGHDIRNPLQAMTSDVYLIKEEVKSIPETDSRKSIIESVDSIEENIAYVNKIVSDLQDYTRPIKPSLAEVDLRSLVNAVLIGCNVPQTIQTYVAIREGFMIKTDGDFIRRILTNLAVNAVQAMPREGTLTIRTREVKDKVLITVEDTGSGIPEDVKDKLFTPLFTTKSKGQGLGLAVVKRLVEGLEGTINFESELGKGTKFVITLPK